MEDGDGSIHTESEAAFAGILPVGRLFAFVEGKRHSAWLCWMEEKDDTVKKLH